ncbi:hypothetical protein BZA05DRAFT_23629 [Tricharina praecox]|uniref:uncharacterized protein n=1 Tax=Tricharina praecox TaxID=43433 RepID=UPI00221E465F|nr:uncharacterized protein BZA05DRAFT_23629 [Tricharina praecox]KAI5859194.1 hypothetical protein BZA05DRAFT_23629 [Tricharina praecox]
MFCLPLHAFGIAGTWTVDTGLQGEGGLANGGAEMQERVEGRSRQGRCGGDGGDARDVWMYRVHGATHGEGERTMIAVAEPGKTCWVLGDGTRRWANRRMGGQSVQRSLWRAWNGRHRRRKNERVVFPTAGWLAGW